MVSKKPFDLPDYEIFLSDNVFFYINPI